MDLFNQVMRDAKCKVAIDAGANSGDYTETLLENGFFTYAFEPVPSMFRKLLKRHGQNKQCFCVQFGLSDKTSIIRDVTVLEAWTIGKPGMGGLSVKPEMAKHNTFNLVTISLDEYLQGLPVGIIKLDVDGYEFKVLRGAEQTIKKYRPPILCELGKYIASIGESPESFVRFILSMDYFVVSMDGQNVFSSWSEIAPQYPYESTFDVMLMPR